MPGSTAVLSNWAPTPSPNMRRKRDFAEVDTVPATSSADPPTTENSSNLNPEQQHRSRKQRRVGPSPSTIPRTLPMQPHEALLQDLKGKYEIATATVISSSKINKKVTSVLSHLGHVDLFSPDSRPGVMMLHARAGDASKMVTVMELAKRRMSEAGVVWYQYNRVYEVTGEAVVGGGKNGGAHNSGGGGAGGSQTVIEDTIMGGEDDGKDGKEDNDEEEDDAFDPIETPFELGARNKPATESKATYMSMFLSRVPIPELQTKVFITLQTNANQMGSQPKA